MLNLSASTRVKGANILYTVDYTIGIVNSYINKKFPLRLTVISKTSVDISFGYLIVNELKGSRIRKFMALILSIKYVITYLFFKLIDICKSTQQ